MESKTLTLCSKEPATFPVLSHENPLDSVPSCFFQTHFIRVSLHLSLRRQSDLFPSDLPNMRNSGNSVWNVFSISAFPFGFEH
jgi:hypothetical protein